MEEKTERSLCRPRDTRAKNKIKKKRFKAVAALLAATGTRL